MEQSKNHFLEMIKDPKPPQYSLKLWKFIIRVFYSVCFFEMVVIVALIIIYPDDFIGNIFTLFISELGAPVTKFGTKNTVGAILFSANMGLATLGGIYTVISIHKMFPKPESKFYQKLRILYYSLILIASIGCIGVILPYTTFWVIHVTGAIICMASMGLGLSVYIYFNVPWIKTRPKLIIQSILFIIIFIPAIPIFMGISQELLQKPVQGMIFTLVMIFPYIHFWQLKKHKMMTI